MCKRDLEVTRLLPKTMVQALGLRCTPEHDTGSQEMSLTHMTVKALRETAKANGLSGYSRMVKADLVALIASNIKVHKIGDVVRNIHNGRVGTVTTTNDAAVIVTCEDGGPKMSGEHYEFTYTGTVNVSVVPTRKKIDRYGHWALSQPCTNGGTWDVRQGHADYCAEYGHATYTVDGVVMSWCPRCGETRKTPEQVISERDTIDQAQMVDVMTQVVNNGREDLIPVLDKIDAAQCPIPDGRNSTIPRAACCPRCTDSVSPCDDCVLAWLVALFNITGPVKLSTTRYFEIESDCYA